MKLVQVLGAGCPKCEQTAKLAAEAAAEAGVQAEVVKVTDFQAMAAMGVFSTPAVAVDGEVKVVGRVPTKAELTAWLA